MIWMYPTCLGQGGTSAPSRIRTHTSLEHPGKVSNGWFGKIREYQIRIPTKHISGILFLTHTMFSVTTNTSESQVHLMLVSSSAHTQPTILQLMASLDSDFLLESTTCSCPSHWWWLGFPWCPGNKQVWGNVWIELVIQTLPLVTALRKKGSSFPANLANSSYFSRPDNWEFIFTISLQ